MGVVVCGGLGDVCGGGWGVKGVSPEVSVRGARLLGNQQAHTRRTPTPTLMRAKQHLSLRVCLSVYTLLYTG